MIRYLRVHPGKAAAWAAVEGIPVTGVFAYIAGLTPMILRYDTYVVNHGFANGYAYPIPEVLQAGQAILVDEKGIPRARCYCGNPLTIAYSPIRHYIGRGWIDFHSSFVITIIESSTVINRFTIIDVWTGNPFTREPSRVSPNPGNTVIDGPALGGGALCMPGLCPNNRVPPNTPTTATTPQTETSTGGNGTNTSNTGQATSGAGNGTDTSGATDTSQQATPTGTTSTGSGGAGSGGGNGNGNGNPPTDTSQQTTPTGTTSTGSGGAGSGGANGTGNGQSNGNGQ